MSEGVNPKDLIGVKKAPLRLVPPALGIAVAPVMALGAAKYGPYNWREYDVKLSVYLEAMLRHLLAAMDGEWLDPESGQPHVAHVAAGVGIVLDAQANGSLVEDWPVHPGPAAKLLAEQAPKSEVKDAAPVPPTRMELVEVLAALGIERPIATADELMAASPVMSANLAAFYEASRTGTDAGDLP